MSITVGINARTFTIDDPGGAVGVGLSLREALADRPDIETRLLGSAKLSKQFPGADVFSFMYGNSSQVYGLLWEQLILPQFGTEGLDVVFCPIGNGPIREIDTPVVLYIHDVSAALGHSSSLRFYKKLFVPWAANAADAVVTVSEFSKKEILEVYDLPREKIHVVHNGLKPLYLSDESGDAVETPERYVLYVGQMNPRKNVAGLVKGFREFNARSDETYRLVLVGPENRLIFENLTIDDDDDIVQMGYLTDQELKYVYDEADAFLFPSLHEGFGLPPLEAMARGVPVVASRAGALPEVLGDFPTYVDPNDEGSIAEGLASVLLDDVPEDRRMDAKAHAREFTWEKAADELCAVFEDVI